MLVGAWSGIGVSGCYVFRVASCIALFAVTVSCVVTAVFSSVCGAGRCRVLASGSSSCSMRSLFIIRLGEITSVRWLSILPGASVSFVSAVVLQVSLSLISTVISFKAGGVCSGNNFRRLRAFRYFTFGW